LRKFNELEDRRYGAPSERNPYGFSSMLAVKPMPRRLGADAATPGRDRLCGRNLRPQSSVLLAGELPHEISGKSVVVPPDLLI
jgi:hypothetical protein